MGEYDSITALQAEELATAHEQVKRLLAEVNGLQATNRSLERSVEEVNRAYQITQRTISILEARNETLKEVIKISFEAAIFGR